ncbi:MAG: AAA family ATPase [Christensenellales bacterium]|jgi:adenylate kinase family enzyme
MKIAVIGYSGSGKSTLARKIAERLGIEVLHIDTVQFLPDWAIRPQEEKEAIVREFLDTHDAWVIDGNYSKLSYERRMEEADIIIEMLFPRMVSLFRVIKRYIRYRNTSRPDMAQGCNEKVDLEFVKWVLWKGRSRTSKGRYLELQRRYPHKTFVVKNSRQVREIEKRFL